MFHYNIQINNGNEAFGTEGKTITVNEVVQTADLKALSREINHENMLIPVQVAESVLQNFAKAAVNLMSQGFAIQFKSGDDVIMRIYPDMHIKGGNINLQRAQELIPGTTEITKENVAGKLNGMAGIIVCPGFGQRGIEGKIVAAEYTRTHDIPTFGICLGMQMMVIEFARNVLGYKDANSREMDNETPHNVIDIMEEQKSITQMGGTMRLGAYDCELVKGSRVFASYGEKTMISERHRHRYEFNNAYKEEYEKKGMQCVGINPAANLVEIVEIPDKRWYIGTQFHPEYSSTVLHPHPLFMSFIRACLVK